MIEWLYTYFSLTEQWLLFALLIVWIYQLWFYLRYMAGTIRHLRRLRKGKIITPIQQPPVSVIICARNEGNNLREYLSTVLTQEYPEYEVIVVNDGSQDDTQSVLEQYQSLYPNLKLTFVPLNARVRSTKKLALTLAAKAAAYDYLLLTDADCRPASKNWISEMMKGFTDKTEIVLGYGAYFHEKTVVNSIIQYDTLFNGLQYLGMAAARHPYMGVGRNLAYRKDVFFRHNGFTKLMDIKAGDDDLFVNREANKKNTAIVVSTDSITWSVPKKSLANWLHQKSRHLSVSPHYKFATKFRLMLEPLTRGAFYALIIALLAVGSLWAQLLALVLFIVRFICQTVILNISASKLQQNQYITYQPVLYDILLPLVNASLMFANIFKRKQTW